MCTTCGQNKLSEISSVEKKKLQLVIKLVEQGRLEDAIKIAETLSTEARDMIPDSVLFKFSIMEEDFNPPQIKYNLLLTKLNNKYGKSWIDRDKNYLEDLLAPILKKVGGTVQDFLNYSFQKINQSQVQEMSVTGGGIGGSSTTPGSGLGMASKYGYKKKKKFKAKSKLAPRSMRLSSLLNEIKKNDNNTRKI